MLHLDYEANTSCERRREPEHTSRVPAHDATAARNRPSDPLRSVVRGRADAPSRRLVVPGTGLARWWVDELKCAESG
jgi:hypothetical protein